MIANRKGARGVIAERTRHISDVSRTRLLIVSHAYQSRGLPRRGGEGGRRNGALFQSSDRVRIASELANGALQQASLLRRAAIAHAERIGRTQNALSQQALSKAKALADLIASPAVKSQLIEQMLEYWTDAAQRTVLTIDVLRERAGNDAAHEAAGTPPILIYQNETIVDGRTLKRPSITCFCASCRPRASRCATGSGLT